MAKDLKKIQMPTLILIGDQDPRLEAAHLMHTNIPKSTMKIFKGVGHEIVAKKAFCAKDILSWLKELPV